MKKQLLSLLVLLSAPTFAAQTEFNTQALQACSFIENDFNRLLCYDNTVAGKPLSKPTVNKTLSPTNTEATAPVAVAVTQAEEFGFRA